MDIAILITNTDDSAFARARPDDGEKFATLLSEVRPGWQFTPYWVCHEVFPEDIARHDGVIITGSPASTDDPFPWIARLTDLSRQVIGARQPLFGACFGHQLIARVLGSAIIRNPDGWGHGRLTVSRQNRAPWSGEAPELSLYGSHIQQVATLPAGASLLFAGPGVPVAGFALGDHVFTIQHHPEMTHAFISDLVTEYADEVGSVVTAAARETLQAPADRIAFADEIARFFEHGAGLRPKREDRHGHDHQGT